MSHRAAREAAFPEQVSPPAMLAFADDAALAPLVIAATAVPRRAFALTAQSRSYDSKTAPRVGRANHARQRRHAARQRAGLLGHLTDTSRQGPDVRFRGQTGKHLLVLSLTGF